MTDHEKKHDQIQSVIDALEKIKKDAVKPDEGTVDIIATMHYNMRQNDLSQLIEKGERLKRDLEYFQEFSEYVLNQAKK